MREYYKSYICGIKTQKLRLLKNTFYTSLLAVCLITSCDISYLDKEIDDNISWDGGFKIPAGNIKYKVSELFTELGTNDTDVFSTEEFNSTYTESFEGNNNDTFNIKIEDTTIENSITTPITPADLALIGKSFPYTIEQEILPGITNPLIGKHKRTSETIYELELTQDITGASFDGGTMEITLNSSIDIKVDVNIEIPSFIKKEGNATYKQSAILEGIEPKVLTIDLSEYNADFTNDGTASGKTNNRIVIKLEATFNFTAGNILKANDAISYSAVLSNGSYEVIYGDFKQEAFNTTSSSLNLDGFFDNFKEGEIKFEDIEMSLNVISDYGFPIGIDLSSIKAINGNSSENLTYTGDQSMANTLIVDEVVNFGDSERVTKRILNSSNSNIQALLEAKPTKIEFEVSGKVNPIDNGLANKNFFAVENEGFKTEVSINVNKISYTKTADFEASDLEDFKSVKLVISVENKIPLGGDVILNLKDNVGNIVHTESLKVFEPANVNSTGESDGIAILTNFDIELTESQIKKVINTKTIDVELTLRIPAKENPIIIKKSDEININIGLLVGANISTKKD
jgi:hypothetical protein